MKINIIDVITILMLILIMIGTICSKYEQKIDTREMIYNGKNIFYLDE